jgi:IS1 family transposase/transposase-like protein
MKINCPKCNANEIIKNGQRRGKQNYRCKKCGRQFVEFYSDIGYDLQTREECLKMYLNGSGFRAIERVKKVNHNTVIRWVKKAGKKILNNKYKYEKPLVGQLDELQTFVGNKKNKIWIWTAVNKAKKGILEWQIGDRSSNTFEKLWEKVKDWKCFFWITDGYKVYPSFIPDGDQIISKTYMTRVEGENSRLRHYLARLHRKTFCYSKCQEMLLLSIKLLIYYLNNNDISLII